MKWKSILVCHLTIAFLLGTFLWPATFAWWQTLDISIFKFLNHTLEGHPWAQVFWTLVNHKIADIVETYAIFLFFFILAIRAAPKKRRLRRIAEFIFCIILVGSIIHFVNRTFLREHALIPRDSPSLVVTPCVRVSKEVPWLLVKDETVTSFPGDHATTLLLFTVMYTFFAGRKFGIYSSLYAIFRILPRLIVGAHWFSDIVVGSGCLVLFFLSWVLCTPFHTWIIDRIEKILTFRRLHEIEKNSL